LVLKLEIFKGFERKDSNEVRMYCGAIEKMDNFPYIYLFEKQINKILVGLIGNV